MNNERRKRIQQAVEQLEAIREELDGIANEEQNAFDNMPESLQGSERGEKMESAIEELLNAVSEIELMIPSLETAKE